MPKVIATVCARSGSKGLPNKNILPFAGCTLLGHAIKQAKQSALIDVVVATSDSEAYLQLAKDAGADYLVHRPDSLSKDNVTKLGAITHAVEEVEAEVGETYDVIVDLDVTSPLREVEDIDGAINLFLEENVSGVITAAPSRRSPYSNMVEYKDNGKHVDLCKIIGGERLSRRQEVPATFDMNAAIYVWNAKTFKNNPQTFYEDTSLYVMSEDRSFDIDSAFDLELVNFIYQRNLDIKEKG